MKRYLESSIKKDLPSKIILLTGPRQSGKTTLSKQLNDSYDYLNYDSAETRLMLKEKSWDRSRKIVIFDELHKMRDWKRWLKGVYDTEGIPPEIIVTGSASLELYKKVGDSLAGRYFEFRLHPLDVKEIVKYLEMTPDTAFEQLWRVSGFPEPFLKNDESYYKRWRRTHLEVILRQDLIDLYSGSDIQAIETLVLLLKERVGSSISYANLARDLERDAKTIKRWLTLLENLYVIFKVTPYHKNISRSLLKEPKYYFYDHALIEDEGAHLENIVASALFKELQFLEDTKGVKVSLHYVRTKEGREIDFVVVIDGKPLHLIEVKQSDDNVSKHFPHFAQYMPKAKKIQLVKMLKREKTFPDGVEVRGLVEWLSKVELL